MLSRCQGGDQAAWRGGQYAIEALAERQLSDAHTHLAVSDGFSRAAVEDEVAEMSVGVEAAQVSLTEIHQDLVRFCPLASVLEIVRLLAAEF